MRAKIQDQILFPNQEAVPQYKKNGSVVRNSYFWALKAMLVSPSALKYGIYFSSYLLY
ncbi:MAG: hypothetical protein LH647_17770 [Leptolyngbyaceae cyanobacterium CAN_BIN12]|nr:hypothetical protein [Leptolyngbyaceae cyanobacterium CAN_BIN12]